MCLQSTKISSNPHLFGSHLQAMNKTNTSAAEQFGSLTDTVTANNLTLAVTPNKVTMICSLLQGEGTDSAGNSASRSGQKVQQHCAKQVDVVVCFGGLVSPLFGDLAYRRHFY